MTAAPAYPGSGPRPARVPRGAPGLRPIEKRNRAAAAKPGARRPAPTARPAARPAPRSGTYLTLLATIAVLNAVGIVMVLSASSVVSITNYGSAWYFFERQLLWTVLGVAAFLFVVHVDYRRWRRFVRPLLVATVAMLVLVLVPGFGVYVAGSRRWLGVGSWRFQPSEVAKLALLLFTADLLTRRKDELGDWRRVLRPALIVVCCVAGLVMLEPDLDSTLLLGMIAAAVLVAGGIRLRHLTAVGGTGLALATVLALAAPYRRARVLTFLHPTADAGNTGYQIVQSLIAMGTGGLTGVGLGAGRAKWHFLPNAHTDFIFAVIGEELGLIGSLLVLSLFVAFAVLGVRVAARAPDRFGMLLAAGITVWVTAQAAINIGGVVGLLPVSGIPLPFVSFGGSSLVFTMVGAGILANIAKQSRPDRARVR
ncbi:MAG TPA: putative lipid II flippase FtsW [Acidimicrobiia bacterium]|nr:putative lipid II flippase FtsW [Acidimicrobiia bacterium]